MLSSILYTLVTNVEASVEVKRPAAQFRPIADPRGWEVNAPLFFKESKICHLLDGDFSSVPLQFPLGDRHYVGLLLEHVSLGFSPGSPIDAVNVLAVYCDPTAPSPTFGVSLQASLETLLGISFERGGLDVDSGKFLTTDVGGGFARVSGTKVARFAEREVFGFPFGRELNYFAPLCLAALMTTLVFEGACA